MSAIVTQILVSIFYTVYLEIIMLPLPVHFLFLYSIKGMMLWYLMYYDIVWLILSSMAMRLSAKGYSIEEAREILPEFDFEKLKEIYNIN